MKKSIVLDESISEALKEVYESHLLVNCKFKQQCKLPDDRYLNLSESSLKDLTKQEMIRKLAEFISTKTSAPTERVDYDGVKVLEKELFCIEPQFLKDFLLAFMKRIPLEAILEIHPEAQNKKT